MPPSCGFANTSSPSGQLLFERVLVPHRSLSVRGFQLLMMFLALISICASVGFVAIGAWPVIGFFGLDIVLLYGAFRLNYRSARRSEILSLAETAFTVERVGIRGDRRVWRFPPFWLRVVLEERPDGTNRLLVSLHAQSLAIGDFLSPAVRRELAATIRDALARWRGSLNPALAGGEPHQRPSTSFSP
jgi:uncharacterized membrane protein